MNTSEITHGILKSLTSYLKNHLSEYKALGSNFIFWFTPEGMKCCYWKFLKFGFLSVISVLDVLSGWQKNLIIYLMTNDFIRFFQCSQFPRYIVAFSTCTFIYIYRRVTLNYSFLKYLSCIVFLLCGTLIIHMLFLLSSLLISELHLSRAQLQVRSKILGFTVQG